MIGREREKGGGIEITNNVNTFTKEKQIDIEYSSRQTLRLTDHYSEFNIRGLQ